jgi:hypothetical protein
MNKNKLIDAYEGWFAKQHFSLFGTLTFRSSPSTSRAARM